MPIRNRCTRKPLAAVRRGIRMAFSPYIVRSRLKADDAVVQMADDFRVINANRGGVEREDLETLGWLPQQIDLHKAAARQRAIAQAGG